MKNIKFIFYILIFFWGVYTLNSQTIYPKNFQLGKLSSEQTQPPSNSVSQIAVADSTFWIGTSSGLANSTNLGNSWSAYNKFTEFPHPGIYALDVKRDTIWTSTGYTKKKDNENIATGGGYTFSTNGGLSWNYVNQTLDSRGDSTIVYGINNLRILPVVVPEQNVTYDISLAPGKVWIASWASGLRYTTNNGIKWNRVVLPPDNMSSIKPSDTLNFYYDPRKNNNFLAFSVLAIDNDTIWCGTAGGINKSTDGGISWKRFTSSNQDSPILGNWVITIKAQIYQNKKRIWTTNWPAGTNEINAVSYSDDGGNSWTNILRGIKAYDFAFKDSVAYIATEQGIYRTDDGGKTFNRSYLITEPENRQVITSSSVFSVGVLGDNILIGTGDGMAITTDNNENIFGAKWRILRKYEPIGTKFLTYAYPNPFAARSEFTRIHYSTYGANADVSIEIFDFGMNRVRTLIQNANRSGVTENDEIWDGKNDDGDYVANGVYFYRVRINNSEPIWNKIMVLQ